MSSASRTETKKRGLPSCASIHNKKAREELVTPSAASIPSVASSDWARLLPAELMGTVACFLPDVRFLLVLSSVHRHLYRLIHGSGAALNAMMAGDSYVQSLIWRHTPLVRLSLWLSQEDDPQQDNIRHSFSAPMWLHESTSPVSHKLTSMRNAPAWHLLFIQHPTCEVDNEPRLQAYLRRLRDFAQLTSLTLECKTLPTMCLDPATLIASFDALHQLKCLELLRFDRVDSKAMRATIRRLCSEQLEHVGLSSVWLRRLAWRGSFALPPMPHVLSFRYTGYPRGSCPVSSLSVFPSLTHAYIDTDASAHVPLRELPSTSTLRVNVDCIRLPRGTASRAHLAALLALSVSSLCVFGSLRTPAHRNRLRELLSRAPDIKQLAITPRTEWYAIRRKADIITALHSFTHIAYPQLDGGLFKADWRILLTPASPPIFATTLRRLALRCHYKHKGTAAALLPSLPLIYTAVTHCYVGSEIGSRGLTTSWSDWQQGRVAWDAALPLLKTALGAVWCESETEVMAWREDVVWRRNTNVRLDIVDDYIFSG